MLPNYQCPTSPMDDAGHKHHLRKRPLSPYCQLTRAMQVLFSTLRRTMIRCPMLFLQAHAVPYPRTLLTVYHEEIPMFSEIYARQTASMNRLTRSREISRKKNTQNLCLIQNSQTRYSNSPYRQMHQLFIHVYGQHSVNVNRIT